MIYFETLEIMLEKCLTTSTNIVNDERPGITWNKRD